MKSLEDTVIRRFANAFSHGRTGFSLNEISNYFVQYQRSIPSLSNYVTKPNKVVFFEDCAKSLSPENQRSALYDLCDGPPPDSKHPMPSEDARKELLALLVQADGRNPLGVEISSLTLRGVRGQWFKAASRIPSSPSGAITAARTLIESTCKTILCEQGETPDASGDLPKLYKQVRTKLGINPNQGASQSVHLMVSGLTQIVDGLAGLSNAAGDRHGLECGVTITELSFASLAVHAAGAVCVFLIGVHHDVRRGPAVSST